MSCTRSSEKAGLLTKTSNSNLIRRKLRLNPEFLAQMHLLLLRGFKMYLLTLQQSKLVYALAMLSYVLEVSSTLLRKNRFLSKSETL